MTRNLLIWIFVPLIFGCVQQTGNNSKSQNDSIKKSLIVENSKSANHTNKVRVDTSAIVKFINYKKDGLILPGEYKLYNDKINVIANLTVKNIKQITILQKTKGKHPQMTNVDYCEWANYLKIINDRDTCIVFGKDILEITSLEEKIKLKSDTINLVLADAFSMKAGDEDGLTGCDDFSYMFINSKNGLYSYVNSKKPNNESNFDFAVLSHNSGVGEGIKDIKISGDTLILSINAEYQEGTGSYKLKIFKSSKWTFIETDRTRKYE